MVKEKIRERLIQKFLLTRPSQSQILISISSFPGLLMNVVAILIVEAQ